MFKVEHEWKVVEGEVHEEIDSDHKWVVYGIQGEKPEQCYQLRKQRDLEEKHITVDMFRCEWGDEKEEEFWQCLINFDAEGAHKLAPDVALLGVHRS